MSDEARKEIYNVILMINHPTEKLEVITAALGIEPHHKWQAGQPRTTPTGTLLPGVNRETYWGFSDGIAGHRYFFETVVELLEKLEAAAEYMQYLLASGGRINLVVHLPGHTNIGDSLAPTDLLRMGRLGIGLGVEVFPEMT